MTFFFFFFNDTATTEIYTLSLHDALPIYQLHSCSGVQPRWRPHHSRFRVEHVRAQRRHLLQDRKSTRLNSSHSQISYAVFCLKKKKEYLAPLKSEITGSKVYQTWTRLIVT